MRAASVSQRLLPGDRAYKNIVARRGYSTLLAAPGILGVKAEGGRGSRPRRSN
jgi:hypothetical protein